jgi:hypothetical protein
MDASVIVLTSWKTTKLGVGIIEEDALTSIQSKLSASNITQELFSSFTARWAPNGSDRSLFSRLDLLQP